MDHKTITALAQILGDHLNQRTKSSDAIQKINSILRNKKSITVIRQLSDYISTRSGRDKNIAVVIVMMAVLRRNLDDFEVVKEAVLSHGLVGQLYGGLFTLLAGDSELLSLRVELNDSIFENKYDFITQFVDFDYWNYIELFQAVKVLGMVNLRKFEKLALKDKTKLILLNMTSSRLEIDPSDQLINELLHEKDELKQNIGFFFITRSITSCLDDINYIERAKQNGVNHCRMNIKEVEQQLTEKIDECYTFLESCNKRTKVSLLINFLLAHQTIYPIAFAYTLMSGELQDKTIIELSNTNKLKTLKDVSFFVQLISDTPALNAEKKRVSKKPLYLAIVDILIAFVAEKRGIYGWDEQQSQYMKLICERLPESCVQKIITRLSYIDSNLMYSKLDELVRFRIYLEDKRQHDIISGIITTIESLTSKGDSRDESRETNH